MSSVCIRAGAAWAGAQRVLPIGVADFISLVMNPVRIRAGTTSRRSSSSTGAPTASFASSDAWPSVSLRQPGRVKAAIALDLIMSDAGRGSRAGSTVPAAGALGVGQATCASMRRRRWRPCHDHPLMTRPAAAGPYRCRARIRSVSGRELCLYMNYMRPLLK